MAKMKRDKAGDLAKVLFMSGDTFEAIAEKVGYSRVTISKWATDGRWRELRAAKSVTRPELVNKLLQQIDNLLEDALTAKANGADDAKAGLADKLSKLASIVGKLDKEASVVDSIEVFIKFNNWLNVRSEYDKELTTKLKQDINKYQDFFVNEQMSIGG